MNTIIDKKPYRTDVFEQVNEIPNGYFVWNIGREHFKHERCVPLCRLANSNSSWQRNVDLENLKYIKVESEKLALRLLKEAERQRVTRLVFREIVEK